MDGLQIPLSPIEVTRSRRKSLPVYMSLDQFSNLVEISHKGSSKVLKARCNSTGGSYALKCFVKNSLSPKEAVHVAREVHLLSSLRGDFGVVQIAGFFEDEMYCYIVMEHCAGRDIYHRFLTNLYFEEEFVCKQVIIPLLNTLHRLHHTHHIIHRDIKPENLLLTGDGELRLADFGTAIKHDNEVPFLPVGTLDFMAPEVLGSPAPKGAVESPCITADMLHELNICPYTEKVDIWSVGALAYELMIGETPFFHEDIEETRKLILGRGSALLFFPRPFQNSPFEAFVRSALSMNPEVRPSALDLLDHPWLAKYQTTTAAGGTRPRSQSMPAVGGPSTRLQEGEEEDKKLAPTVSIASTLVGDPSAKFYPLSSFVSKGKVGDGSSGSSSFLDSQSSASLLTSGLATPTMRSNSDMMSLSSTASMASSLSERDSKLADQQRVRSASAPLPPPPSWTLDRFPATLTSKLLAVVSEEDQSSGNTSEGDIKVVKASNSRLYRTTLSLRRITERNSTQEAPSSDGRITTSAPTSRRGSSFLKPRRSSKMSSISVEISVDCGNGAHARRFSPSEENERAARQNRDVNNKGQLTRLKSLIKPQSWLRTFSLKSLPETEHIVDNK